MTHTQKLNAEIARLRDDIHNANMRADRAERERNDDTQGWTNKWRAAIDMAARAQLECDDLRANLRCAMESLDRMRGKRTS